MRSIPVQNHSALAIHHWLLHVKINLSSAYNLGKDLIFTSLFFLKAVQVFEGRFCDVLQRCVR